MARSEVIANNGVVKMKKGITPGGRKYEIMRSGDNCVYVSVQCGTLQYTKMRLGAIVIKQRSTQNYTTIIEKAPTKKSISKALSMA